jgi:hypothetical protein
VLLGSRRRRGLTVRAGAGATRGARLGIAADGATGFWRRARFALSSASSIAESTSSRLTLIPVAAASDRRSVLSSSLIAIFNESGRGVWSRGRRFAARPSTPIPVTGRGAGR